VCVVVIANIPKIPHSSLRASHLFAQQVIKAGRDVSQLILPLSPVACAFGDAHTHSAITIIV
jgi:hypothetical protein